MSPANAHASANHAGDFTANTMTARGVRRHGDAYAHPAGHAPDGLPHGMETAGRLAALLVLSAGFLLAAWGIPTTAGAASPAAAAVAGSAANASPASNDALAREVQRVANTLRCVVCQNQSIGDSQSGLALDLKAQIHQQLAQGRTEAQIREYMVQRYGEYILYEPPLRASTALLWFGPFLLLLVAAWTLWRIVKPSGPRAAAAPLTPAQRRRAAELLEQGSTP